MSLFLALPILGGLLILETAVLNQMPLLHGTADLVLLAVIAWSLQKRVQTGWAWGVIGALIVGYVSAVPVYSFLFGYLIAVGLAIGLRQRLWSVPVLAMLITTFVGTIVLDGVTMLTLRVLDKPVQIGESINLIVLPGLLIHLVLAIPFFLFFSDLARWLHPETLEM